MGGAAVALPPSIAALATLVAAVPVGAPPELPVTVPELLNIPATRSAAIWNIQSSKHAPNQQPVNSITGHFILMLCPRTACALEEQGLISVLESDLGRWRSRLRVRERERGVLRRSLRGGVGSFARREGSQRSRSGDLARLWSLLDASSRSRRSAMAFSLAESLSLCMGDASVGLPTGSL